MYSKTMFMPDWIPREDPQRLKTLAVRHMKEIAERYGRKVYSPDRMTAVYERLGRLGPPLYITEITVPGVGKDGPAQQAAIVANLYRLWFSTPSMAGVTWWNLADNTAFGNENAALGSLLDKDITLNPPTARSTS